MISTLPKLQHRSPAAALSECPHRSVAKDGRIICAKILLGDNAVSPNTCRDCPFIAINCTHLRFSLQQSSPSPLIIRFNGRTEIWDDDPPQLSFEQAACAAKVLPIDHPSACAACPLRQPLLTSSSPAHSLLPKEAPSPRPGKVVAFPARPSFASAS